jgi:hypothetical protein
MLSRVLQLHRQVVGAANRWRLLLCGSDYGSDPAGQPLSSAEGAHNYKAAHSRVLPAFIVAKFTDFWHCADVLTIIMAAATSVSGGIARVQTSRRSRTIGDFNNGSVEARFFKNVEEVFPGKKRGTHVYRKFDKEDEIRVLCILNQNWVTTNDKPDPTDETDKIENPGRMYCVLLPMSLPRLGGNRPVSEHKLYEYEALSYTWGDAREWANCKIKLANHTWSAKFAGRIPLSRFSNSSFYVRPNLYAALMHFRHVTNNICLWIDAVCINQDDQEEKTAQVSRMHEIYSEATNVCGWLGSGSVSDDGETTRRTFMFLRDILNLEHLDKLIERDYREQRDEMLRNLLLVTELLKNRYFSRRWIVQELALARRATVRWGEEGMDWNDFSDAIDLFVTKQDKFKEILGRDWNQPVDLRVLGAAQLVHIASNLLRKSENGRVQQKLASLEMLVCCMLLAFEAKESRDTIYAALSIARETSSHISDLTARTSRQVSSRLGLSGHVSFLTELLLHSFGVILHVILRVVARRTNSSATDALLRTHLDQRIQPNYQKCLLDVCTDFIDYCIEDSNSLDVLCRHWAPVKSQQNPPSQEENEIDSLPSWISSQGYYAYGSAREHLGGRKNGDSFVGPHPEKRNYHASRNLYPCYRFVKNRQTRRNQGAEPEAEELETAETVNGSIAEKPVSSRYTGKLLVRGQRLAKITQFSGRHPDGVILSEAFELGGWQQGSTSADVPEKLWRTLVADRGPHNTNPPTWYRRACHQCLVSYCTSTGDLNTNFVKNHAEAPSTMKMFIERVQSVTWNRGFFEATEVRPGKAKRFGLAPGHARVGDLICILFGCSVPVVLRRGADGPSNTFTFVGECFVHGMMDGEALHMASKVAHPYREHSEEFGLV